MGKTELPVGTVLKSHKRQYRILRTLGKGGFGITYLVEGKIENIKVQFAIKEHFISSLCERDVTNLVTYSNPLKEQVEGAKKSFIAEAGRLYQLGAIHPNIVGVNEVFEANNTAYYVMEYIHGISLRKYVEDKGRLSVDEGLAITTAILDALNTLHANRITHLDIKPDNILVSIDPVTNKLNPILIDFGLSKHYDEEGRATSTLRTQGVSDGFAPIEQYAGITEFSPESDIYSVAATFLFMLTGEIPPMAVDVNLDAVRTRLESMCNDAIVEAIIKAMAPMRSTRTKSARDFLIDLEQTVSTAELSDLNNSETKVITDHPVELNRQSDFQSGLKPVTPSPPSGSGGRTEVIAMLIFVGGVILVGGLIGIIAYTLY